MARLQRLRGQTPQVFDERQLQHAGPGPELANRQRGDALVAVDEHRELLAVEPAVAVTHQFDGHRVDPRVTRLLAGSECGQFAVVGAGQMLADVADFRRQQVVVVEQPFRRGGDRAACPDVLRQGPVRAAQHARVVVETGKDVAGAAARARVDREARREGQRTLFEPLGAEQLVAKRLLRVRRPTQPFEQIAHRMTTARGHHEVPRAGVIVMLLTPC